MATCTHAVVTPDSGSTPNASGPFTPASNDLLVVFVVGGNSVTPAAGELTNSEGLTFHLAAFQDYPPSASHLIACYVANTLASAVEQTVTFDPADTATSSVIAVLRVAGMSKTGSDAVRQFKTNTQNAGTDATPGAVFDAACLTGNVVIGAAANLSTPAGLTAPAELAEAADDGTTTPTIGLEYAFVNSGFTGTALDWGTSATNWGALILELDTSAASAALTVTDVDTDESITATQANVVVTGTEFGATQGNSYLALVDNSGASPETEIVLNQSIDSWADTSIQFDASIGTNPGIRYGTKAVRVGIATGSPETLETADLAVTITVPSGGSPQTLDKNYVDLTSVADSGDRLSASADLAIGDQIEWSNVIGGTIADVTVYPDGSFSFVDGVDSFDFRVHNVTEGWGSIATVSTAGVAPTVTTESLGSGRVGVDYDGGVQATGDEPITWDITAGALPDGLSLTADSGEIVGTPTTAETANFTVRATNALGTDTAALSIVILSANVSLTRFVGFTIIETGLPAASQLNGWLQG